MKSESPSFGHGWRGFARAGARRFQTTQARPPRLLAIRHIFTRPYTSKTNGKAERFIQTLLREWANGLAHPSSNARNADLARW